MYMTSVGFTVFTDYTKRRANAWHPIGVTRTRIRVTGGKFP